MLIGTAHHHDQVTPLTWPELAQDLRLARHWSDDILIHSLEGCVWHGFLGHLRSFDWAQPVTPPDLAWAAEGLRRTLQATLWATGHPRQVLATTAAMATLLRARRRWGRRPPGRCSRVLE